ncbi:MAG: cytidylyltransferase domain-containing protein [Syntrophorhabdaceae bacterium]
MRRIVAIIQARMNASRLPGKMMLSLHGSPIIEWVVRRVASARMLDEIVVAIPDTSNDDFLAQYVTHALNAKIYRGSEKDVLNRFLGAAKMARASHVVRVCADNPLVSGEVIDDLIRYFCDHPCDYAYNQGDGGRTNSYPDGLGAEMVPFALLEWLDQHAVDARHREHCLTYVVDNPHRFTIKTFDPIDQRIACPWLKLDMDNLNDYCRLAHKCFSITSSPFDIVQAFWEKQ